MPSLASGLGCGFAEAGSSLDQAVKVNVYVRRAPLVSEVQKALAKRFAGEAKPAVTFVEGILAHHPPPAVAGRRLKVKYITQVKTRPPGFVVSCSRPEAMPQSYVRYLSNSLRDSFEMPGVPIRIALRAPDNPYAGKAKKRS